ncbi:Nitric oxide reductase subunit C [wastewater metagenome]|uniref:Nitric oxide reductase subunit C n=2 Tax=unclassified sequences TaxID=12908 RepID=A0A5B8RFS5_9ZZZZ|nr:cytochrome c [Arhodomonas sp. KWT]QEA07481.1 nitric oxide reductase subunit C [uncultured organism]
MSERFTKGMARNIYYGGSLFFILLFVGLTLDTVTALPDRENRAGLTDTVAEGKEVWERNDCIGCHTLLGEGAYFAPELGNVFERRGNGNEAAFKAYLNAWINAQPTQAPGRRQMPQFNLSDHEINALAEFLIWTSRIRNNDWPPNVEG